MRLLVVEDDVHLASILERGLKEEGYQIDLAHDGEDALLFTDDREYEVIILDRKLPKLSGDQVLSQLRSCQNWVPVIMLTALDSVDDRVKGLTKGADDYICKPFAFEELLARIQSLQRRKGQPHFQNILLWQGLTVDLTLHQVNYKGKVIDLTPREFRLLEVFLRRPKQVVPRERLAEQVWDDPCDVQSNTIEAHVKNLRKKIEPVMGQRIIQTVRGFGYKLVDENEAFVES